MIDLGANYDYYSALWLAGDPASRALAVEPSPESLALLRVNLAPFGSRAQIVAACITDREGSATMHRIGGHGMLSQLLDPRNARNPSALPDEGHFPVVTLRLESLFRDFLGDAACEFLKVDIEGMDALALLDALPLFAAHRIRCVAWESMASAADRELENHLARSGYHALACDDAVCYALD
jgi:FkbM family methyltransferase